MKKFVIAAVMFGVTTGVAAAQMAPPAAQPAAQPAVQAPAPPPMPASPPGKAATQVGGKWVEEKPGADPRYREGKWIVVEYNRPILRGRQGIFGTGADYGKKVSAGSTVWRAGANQTTRLKTEVPLVFGDKTIPAGEYSVFVDLKEGAWTLIFSTQGFQQKYDRNNKADTWGSYNYDPKFDVARVPMTVSTGSVSVDEFTIGFVNMAQDGGSLAMWWDKTMATAAFKVAQ